MKLSIIIPHKDTPELLHRCLDSIPIRNDVQVIVVDDDSNPDIVNFARFPGIDRPKTEIYLSKEGRGAGHARNIGLSHAQGEWITFLDADDFFALDASDLFDKIFPIESDIVFFDIVGVMSDDISVPSRRNERYHKYIVDALKNNEETGIRYCFHPLWGKMIKRSLIEKKSIRFSETKWSNDIYFSTQIGCYANRIKALPDKLYYVTQSNNSLTSDFCGTFAEFKARLSEAKKSENLIKKHQVFVTRTESYNILKYVYDEKGMSCYCNYLVHLIVSPSLFWKMFFFLTKRVIKNIYVANT